MTPARTRSNKDRPPALPRAYLRQVAVPRLSGGSFQYQRDRSGIQKRDLHFGAELTGLDRNALLTQQIGDPLVYRYRLLRTGRGDETRPVAFASIPQKGELANQQHSGRRTGLGK